MRVLRAPEASAVRRMYGGAAPDHHGHAPWVKVVCCLLFRIVLQDALSEIMKVLPPLRLKVSVDDITACTVQ